MAIWARRADLSGLVHRADRGVQYLSILYTERLADAGAVASVGSRRDSHDNALASRSSGCPTHRRNDRRQLPAVPGEEKAARPAGHQLDSMAFSPHSTRLQIFLTSQRDLKYRHHVMKEARAYESPLRAEQMEQTRLRILRAVTEALADPTTAEVTIPLVAGRARVSLRTVYRHFRTREALFDAWAEWVDDSLRIHLHSYPERADRLPEFALELYRSYDESESLVKAMLDSKAARAVRKRTRRRRQRQFERAMSELTDELEPKERLRAIAVLYLLVSAPAWQAMREQWGLDGVEAGKAAAWAVRVLVDELNRNPDSIRDVTKEETT